MSERWGLYVRVSTPQQVDGFSLDDQREKLVAYADSLGWEWEVFEDPGVSGELLRERPGMTALVEAVDRGTVQGIAVVDESRLARNDYVGAKIRDHLRRAGARLATLERGVLDLTKPTERFLATVIAGAHTFDQDLRTAKMITGLRRTAEAGYWPGGPAPYGYRLVPSDDGKHTKLAINDEEAKVLRLVADLIVNKGCTTYSAAAYLNASAIRTRRGRPWRHTNLSWQLRKPHTEGEFVYDPEGVSIPFDIDPIFTLDEWTALQQAIRGKPRPGRRNRLYPLTGRGRVHLRCGCGGNFFGFKDTSKKSKVVYQCARNEHTLGHERCPHRPRVTPAEALEREVWTQLVSVLADPGYLARLATEYISTTTDVTPNEVAGLERRLGELRSQETRLIRRSTEDDVHIEATERALDEVASERITVEKKLERLQEAQQGALSTESVPRPWNAFPLLDGAVSLTPPSN